MVQFFEKFLQALDFFAVSLGVSDCAQSAEDVIFVNSVL